MRPDVPDSPEAVGEWLRASPALTVVRQTELAVDGRTALRFDLIPGSCDSNPPPPRPPYFGVCARLYAIPTARDTFIVSSCQDGASPIGEAWTEALIRSLTFRSG